MGTLIRKYADQGYVDIISGQAVPTTTAVTQVIAAQGGRQLLIDDIDIDNGSTDTKVRVDILSGSTVIWSIPAPFGGGAVKSFTKPLPANPGEAVKVQLSGAIAAGVTVSIKAHILPTTQA